MVAKSKNAQSGMELAERHHDAPRSESQWVRSHFSVKRWESDKHQSWGLPAEGFRDHVATVFRFLEWQENLCVWVVSCAAGSR